MVCKDYHNKEEWEESTRMMDDTNNTIKPKFREYVQTWRPAITIPSEFKDFHQVLVQAASSGKYEANNWLEPNGHGTAKKSMYGSIFRHVAEAYHGVLVDTDSGLDPRLHAAVRLMMDYTRSVRGIVNLED